jgi:hypothetical protein
VVRLPFNGHHQCACLARARGWLTLGWPSYIEGLTTTRGGLTCMHHWKVPRESMFSKVSVSRSLGPYWSDYQVRWSDNQWRVGVQPLKGLVFPLPLRDGMLCILSWHRGKRYTQNSILTSTLIHLHVRHIWTGVDGSYHPTLTINKTCRNA